MIQIPMQRIPAQRAIHSGTPPRTGTMTNGYSDRINHALAFAAKHHDQMVRRGTRLPYATHAANVAIILTRYGREDETVIGGILHNVISDYLSDGFTRERLDERIGEKFGVEVLETVLSVTERRFDDDGVELSTDERKTDLIARLNRANGKGLWIFAADKLHLCAALLADLRRTEFRETVWERQPHGRVNTIRWFSDSLAKLREADFDAPIMAELGRAIEELERFPE
jgi:(p)ppGpp synthase/HD superfamily hydrolase